jgi:hypothetical protein
MKPRRTARSRASASVILTALAFGANGCIFVSHEDDAAFAGRAELTTIDAGRTLSTELGEGAGLFVEYQAGGRWNLWSSCDTKRTGHLCDWEVNVRSHSVVGSVDLLNLEGSDHVDVVADDQLVFFATTDLDSDQIQFSTSPGVLVEMEAFLDGLVAPDYFVWVSNGAVRNGATGSPVIFNPDLP